MSTLLVETDPRGVARITLNRPEIHNAFDDALIADLTATLKRLAADTSVRVLVLTGAGPNFSAGADLNWMRRMAGYGHADNVADASALAAMLRLLDEFPRPTVARVNGSAFAGGIGLIACCDIAVAASEAKFAVTEVRLGLIPATIGPYLVAAIGARAARRYFLTAERFSADEARRIGLVHEVAAADALDTTVDKIISALLEGGPKSQARSKRLIAEVDRAVDDGLMNLTAEAIGEARASAEGREGVAAFLAKRKPDWR